MCNSLCSRIRSLSFPLVMEDDLELAEIEYTQDTGKADQELGESGLDIDGNQGQVSDKWQLKTIRYRGPFLESPRSYSTISLCYLWAETDCTVFCNVLFVMYIELYVKF